MAGTDFAGTITSALTSSGFDATAIAAVAGAGVGLGVVMYGFRRAWSFFKGLAK